MNQGGNKFNYDLEERLAKFVERVIDLMKKLPNNAINKRMIPQVVASCPASAESLCPGRRILPR